MPTIQVSERVKPLEAARQFGVNYYRRAAELGCTVSQLMERDDPTSAYAEGAQERQLDAFERMMHADGLLATDIPEYGVQASTWQEATETAPRRAMIHEYCARVWRQTIGYQAASPMARALIGQGAGNRSLLFSTDTPLNTILQPYVDDLTPRAKRLIPPVPLERIVARTTQIQGSDAYRSLYITDDFGTDAYRYKRVAEGAEIPSTSLITGEHTIRLHKFGRSLRTTYEQIRRQRLDRVAWIIARMALQAEVDKVAMVIGVIVNGDGNANTAAPVVTLTSLDPAATAGTLTLKGWLTFKNRFVAGYTLDTVLVQEATLMQLLLLPVNTVNGIPLALLAPGGFGSIAPVQNLLAGGVEYGLTADAPALKIVGIDSRLAVERVTEIGGTISEIERFISNQTEQITMSEVEGYAAIDVWGASKILNVNG